MKYTIDEEDNLQSGVTTIALDEMIEEATDGTRDVRAMAQHILDTHGIYVSDQQIVEHDTQMFIRQLEQEEGNKLYDRIRAGETIAVRTRTVVDVNGVTHGDACFSIQCEKTCWGFYVYSALRNGRRIKGHNRMILDTETARDWCAHLEEVKTEETQP